MLQVMLVEDEEIERRALELIINRYFSLELLVCYQTNNGKSAVEYMQSNSVDLIIMDIEMPVMNGILAAKEIRSLHPDVKIIILTAYSEFDYAKGAIEAKALHYLLKPINTNEFRAVLRELIDRVYYDQLQKAYMKQDLESIIDLTSNEKEVYQMFLLLYNNQLNSAFELYQSVIEKAYQKKMKQNMVYKIGTHFICKITSYIRGKSEIDSSLIRDFSFSSKDMESFLSASYEYLSILSATITQYKLKSNHNLHMVEKAKQYIHENFRQELSLEDVSERVHLNADYFGKLFKQVVGINFKEYLIDIRIKKAIELIESGEYSIKEISYAVGYSDPNYFSRSFKKNVGISAVEYRNQRR